MHSKRIRASNGRSIKQHKAQLVEELERLGESLDVETARAVSAERLVQRSATELKVVRESHASELETILLCTNARLNKKDSELEELRQS